MGCCDQSQGVCWLFQDCTVTSLSRVRKLHFNTVHKHVLTVDTRNVSHPDVFA